MSESTAEEQELILDAVRAFARNELIDADRRWDAGEGSASDFLPAAADMGLMGLVLSEEHGGMACPMSLYARILEEVAYASPSMAVTLSVHCMTGKIVERYGQGDECLDSLSQWGSSDALSAFAVSEADAGSDPSAVKTRADRVEGGYRINGSKMWITNGATARWLLVLARTGLEQSDNSGLTALLVDGNADGIERDRIHGKMGIRGSDTVVLHLNDVFVPQAYLIGAEGEGLKVCLCALDEGRVGIASQAIGIAQACLDEMTAYAQQREQFGRPIAEFQAIQNMVADSAVEVDAARLLRDRAAHLIDTGQPSSMASAMAKLFASESANRIAYRAVQVHGGSGYVSECRVERLYRDARITTIYEGTSEIQRHVIARDLFSDGLPGQ